MVDKYSKIIHNLSGRNRMSVSDKKKFIINQIVI